MNTHLQDTLRARAERAPATPDLDALLTDIRDRADQAGRRRRNLMAAGGGSLAIVALAAGVIAVAPGGRPDSSGPGAPASSTAAAEPSTRASGLVAVAPAPRSAEVSIALVPADWVLLGSQGPVTLYGPRSLVGSTMSDFEGKLLVSVHERIGTGGTYPLMISGRPASYQEGNGDTEFQGVDVIVDETTEVNIQVPPTAGLTRAEIIRLANTLDVRSTVEKTHG